MAFDYELHLLPATAPGVTNNFGKLHSIEGIIFHTTEGAGFTKADAISTANWQKTVPGSYNFIIYDGGALLTIPFLEASGGLNPATTFWQPERFPFLKAGLDKPCPGKVPGCPGPYKNPTMHNLQVSFSGRRNVMDLGGPEAQRMVKTAQDLIAWYEGIAGKKLFISGHMHWQSNRSDPGQYAYKILSGSSSLPDTSVPKEEQMIVVTEEPFPSPVRFGIEAGTTIKAYDPKVGLVKTVKFNENSSASASGYSRVVQDPSNPSRVPHGTFIKVANGIFAGLLIVPSDVTLAEVPNDFEDGRQQGVKEGADLVKRAAVKAARSVGA